MLGAGAGVTGVGVGPLAPIHPASSSLQGWRWVPRSVVAQLGWGMGAFMLAPIVNNSYILKNEELE